MRIALVTETYPPEVNGVAMTLGRLVNGLNARGDFVHVVRPRQSDRDRAESSGFLRQTLVRGIPIPGYSELCMGLPAKSKLAGLWREWRPDIVHVATEGPLGWSAVRAARKLKLPVSSSYHTNFQNYSSHYGAGFLKRFAMAYLRHFHNRTEATFSPTEEMCEALEKEGFRNLMVMGRGVDTRLFSPVRRSDALRRQWGAEAETLIVGYFGRLAAEKNLSLAVRSFVSIREKNPGARFVLVGDGPLAGELKRAHGDFIFCGMKHGEDLAAHYASADLFLFPSMTETFGNVVTEAMASGLPVVAYDYAAARQYLRKVESRAVVEFGDEPAFVDAACRIAEDADERASLGRRSREVALSLGWERVVEAFESHLEEIIRSKGTEL